MEPSLKYVRDPSGRLPVDNLQQLSARWSNIGPNEHRLLRQRHQRFLHLFLQQWQLVAIEQLLPSASRMLGSNDFGLCACRRFFRTNKDRHLCLPRKRILQLHLQQRQLVAEQQYLHAPPCHLDDSRKEVQRQQRNGDAYYQSL